MDYTCKDTIIENMRDFGCDETTISEFLECFDCCDIEGQKKILDKYRIKILQELHTNQKNIDLLDYMMYQLEQYNCK